MSDKWHCVYKAELHSVWCNQHDHIWSEGNMPPASVGHLKRLGPCDCAYHAKPKPAKRSWWKRTSNWV